jgi:hypothetical protein
MKRLLPILTLALLGLSACDSGTLVSPLEPEVGEPSFAKPVLPGIEPTVHHSASEPCSFPQTLIRAPGAPTRVVCEFTGEEEVEMTLVVEVSDPKITTVKAWLNGVMVLLPSTNPLPGDDNQVKVALGVVPGVNVLDVRLSAKPGEDNWVRVWVEADGEGDGGAEGEGDPGPIILDEDVNPTFTLGPVVGPGADMAVVCGEVPVDGLPEGTTWTPADWTDVEAAIEEDERDPGIVPLDGLAWITWNGLRSPDANAFPYPYYYMISADENDAAPYFPPEDTIEAGPFWLVSGLSIFLTQQPVLCVSTEGVSTP